MSKKATNEAIQHRMELAKDFIETHYAQDISIETIATSVHLSKAHFARKFKEVHNVSPNQYLVKVRLVQSIKLLAETTLPLNEIVNQIGFYSASSFIRLFKKEYGTTPMVFRKEQKKGTI